MLMACLAVCSAFTAAPTLRPASSHAALASRAATASMVVEPSTVADASTLLALSIPIPAYSPAKAFVMMFSNILIISTMTIQGKGLSKGISEGMSPQAAHDDMVASFGLTWLLSGTALGHIVGAGAILGCSAGGWF